MYLLIGLLMIAVVVGVGLATFLDRRRVQIPDYADPDVDEVPVEDLLNDNATGSDATSGHPTGGAGMTDARSSQGRWDRLG